MKILLVHNYYQYRGGEESYFESLTQLLKKNGYEVKQYIRKSNEIKDLKDKIKVAISLFWNTEVDKELTELIKKYKPEIAHFQNIYPLIGPTAYRVCQKNHIPIVQTVHNYRFMCPKGTLFRDGKKCELCLGKTLPFPAIFFGCYHNSKLASFFFSLSFFFHKILRTFTMINFYIFPTTFTKNFYLKNLNIDPANTQILPYFIEEKKEDKKRLQEEGFFLFVGRLSEEKGVKELVEIFRKLTHIQLIVLGDGPLKESISKYRKYNNIRILGRVSKAKVLKYMKKSKCVIIPSLWYEVLPYVYLEALSLEKRVLMSDNINIKKEATEANTFFYKGSNQGDLKNKILTINSIRERSRVNIPSGYASQSHFKILKKIYNLLKRN